MKIAFVLPSLANKGPIIVAKDLCEEYRYVELSDGRIVEFNY